MDDKYTGCNIVESVVTPVPSSRSTEEKTQSEHKDKGTHFFVRLIISALIIGVILVLHYCPSLPFASGISDALRQVFCFDVFGRTSFGPSIFDWYGF